MRFRTRALMLTWAPYSGRSEGLAQHLGIENYFIHYLAFQRPWIAPAKYPLQAAATLRILLRGRPATILVQNPPPVAPLLASLYCAVTGAGLIVDSHSQVLLVRRWRWTLPLQRWLVRRALTTVVTNEHLADIIRGWNAPVLVAGDPPIAVPPLGPRQPPEEFSVVCVCTYGDDEPIGEVLAAARLLPDVRFAFTGNTKYARPEWLADPPPNVEFTGFVPMDEYYRRIHNASALVVLTTLDHTVLRGAWEALALGQPLITSDWGILRDYFSPGALFVDNSPAGIAAAIRDARADEATLRQKMAETRETRRRAWQEAQAYLEGLIDGVWARAPKAAALAGQSDAETGLASAGEGHARPGAAPRVEADAR
ncbi:MAG TPA: glycosyltransferase [Chloroflexota bacterium]|jgi:glycosyltransferase involved in cell wall biosynthesis